MKPEDLEYCRKSLEKSDYDHYLISLFMPIHLRPALWTIGAFKNVIETIPGLVSDPALGYMRLTWWRDQIKILEEGGLTKGQPVLASLKQYTPHYANLTAFINEYERLVENPKADFSSSVYPDLLGKILGPHITKYRKLENRLTQILKKHHGSKWEHNPPFLALRLWWACALGVGRNA